MPRWVRIVLVLASVSALGFGSRVARAQTTPATTTTTTGAATPCSATVTMPTISVSNQSVPERFLNFGTSQRQDLGPSTRPDALNPNGINYSDCIEDMTLEFQLTGCGFNGTSQVKVWASTSSDCTTPAERGIGQASVCWLVSEGSIPNQQAGGLVYDIRVQDIVGPQASASPDATTLTRYGISACSAQSTYLPVPININFVPIVPGSGALAGQNYEYTLQTDMVGPPAPQNVKLAAGDTLLVVNWTPNPDTDTAGYDVVIDPLPGQDAPAGGPTTVLVCPADSGMSTSAGVDAADDGAANDGAANDGAANDGAADDGAADDGAANDGAANDGAATDATADANMGDASDAATRDSAAAPALDDAGCYTSVVSGSGSAGSGNGNGGMCNDSLLSGGTMVSGGGSVDAGTPAPEELDDAGNAIVSDASVATPAIGGGIWVPPAGHVVNPNPTIGSTSSGEANSTYTITGLTNHVLYNVVVASVDNFGNVGPPSVQACNAEPKPVNDFWKTYRSDGGGAGGGFCALEAVGAPAGSTVALMGAGALALAGVRRRRSKRR